MFNLMSTFLLMTTISLTILLINFNLSFKKINKREKLSPFECGFDPFTSPRLPFSIQFYLIGIIFLIFDIEILIFLPMISTFIYNKKMFWLKTIMLFIMILLMGLYIEWNEGALKWLK